MDIHKGSELNLSIKFFDHWGQSQMHGILVTKEGKDMKEKRKWKKPTMESAHMKVDEVIQAQVVVRDNGWLGRVSWLKKVYILNCVDTMGDNFLFL